MKVQAYHTCAKFFIALFQFLFCKTLRYTSFNNFAKHMPLQQYSCFLLFKSVVEFLLLPTKAELRQRRRSGDSSFSHN